MLIRCLGLTPWQAHLPLAEQSWVEEDEQHILDSAWRLMLELAAERLGDKPFVFDLLCACGLVIH